MNAPADTLDYTAESAAQFAVWLPGAVAGQSVWNVHLAFGLSGGVLFRDRSEQGLERLHLVAFSEEGREELVGLIRPLAEEIAGAEGLLAIERYRVREDHPEQPGESWHAWFFIRPQEDTC